MEGLNTIPVGSEIFAAIKSKAPFRCKNINLQKAK
jgi:hypothetical protein